MRELTVLSGKGGTGKTSLVASFAALCEHAVLADCDVDAPDLELVLGIRTERTSPFVGGKTALVDVECCIACGRCVEVCRFGAVSLEDSGEPNRVGTDQTCTINPLACEGCGVCGAFCPNEAIDLVPAVGGEWFISRTRHGPMVHARLGIAEDNSGKLVSLVRKEAKALARRESLELVICDGPPGIGCPTIAALGGADLILLVVEPTVSGIHDFERVAKLAEHFKVAAVACVNKFDINEEMTRRIEELAGKMGVEVVGRIPYDEAVVAAQLRQTSVVEYGAGASEAAIRNVWKQVKTRLDRSVVPSGNDCVAR